MNKLLIIILIMAGILRFVGAYPGYNQYHSDEGISYSAATSMIKNGNLDPLRYDYPALVPSINYVFFKFVFIPFQWIRYFVTHISGVLDGVIHIPIAPLEAKRLFQVYVLGERERNALFWGRYVTAFFSLGNVFLTYLLAKKLFNKKVGLIAAFLLAFNFKSVINSHIGLPDIYNAFFTLLIFLAAINLWKSPTRKNYLLAGIAAGLSFSIKYQFFGFLPLCLAHFYASLENNRLNLRKLFRFDVFLLAASTLLVILLVNPYHIAFLQRTIEIVKGVSIKYGMGTEKINLYPIWYFWHIDYGPIELILVLVGFLISLKAYFKKTLLFLFFLIPFSFMFFYYSIGGFYVRNFITITPILLIFAATAIWSIYKFFRGKVNHLILNVVFVAFLICVVFIPGRNSVINSYNYTKPWGYDLMRPWIQNNLPKDVMVAAHSFDATNLGIKNKRTEFEVAGSYSLNEHKENKDQYAVINLDWAGSTSYFWMSFGFDKLGLYWDKPLSLMRNMFQGLATEEMFRYQVHAVTKPWQAPDAHLLVIKLPEWPEVPMSNIAKFDFDGGLTGWTLHGNLGRNVLTYGFDKEVGHSALGSIVFFPGEAEYAMSRITSTLIPVKEGHLYKIDGFLKTQLKLESKERDGFLRLDFYGENPDLENIGIISSLSARVYGTDDWIEKEITERAPKGSKFLTVSFQTFITTRTKIWLDDVSVYESNEVVDDITAKAPYDIQKIDLNYLYPNSHGNL